MPCPSESTARTAALLLRRRTAFQQRRNPPGPSPHRGRRGRLSLLGLALLGRPEGPVLPARLQRHPDRPPRCRRPLQAGEGAAAAPWGGGEGGPPPPGHPPCDRGKGSRSPPPQRRYRPRAPPRPGASPSPTPRRARAIPARSRADTVTRRRAAAGGGSGCPGDQDPPFTRRSLPRPPTSALSPARPGWGSRTV